MNDMKTPPEHLVEYEETYSNFDNLMPEGAENILKKGEYYIAHPAHDHWGAMWYEEGKFYEKVMQYTSHIDTVSAESLRELFYEVNVRYGSD